MTLCYMLQWKCWFIFNFAQSWIWSAPPVPSGTSPHRSGERGGAASRGGGSNYKEEEYKQRENRQLRLLGYCTSAFGYIAKLGHGPDTATAAAKWNILNVAGRAAARDGESKECLFQVSFVAQVSARVSAGPPAARPRPLYYCSLV